LERAAAPAMLSMRRAYGKIADLDHFAGPNLDDPLEASPAEQRACEQRACTAGHDHRHRPAETLERGEVEVVVVEVEDQHRADAPTERLGVVKRTGPPQVRNATPERRIGE
jgi:hypothetical protein